jgi:hypothetical protein
MLKKGFLLLTVFCYGIFVVTLHSEKDCYDYIIVSLVGSIGSTFVSGYFCIVGLLQVTHA